MAHWLKVDTALAFFSNPPFLSQNSSVSLGSVFGSKTLTSFFPSSWLCCQLGTLPSSPHCLLKPQLNGDMKYDTV